MFLENKYAKTYLNLIQRAKNRSLHNDIYTEKHHIIPRSLGGDNSKSNIAVLTAREHYIAHLLLTKMTDGNDKRKMALALSFFNTKCKNHQVKITAFHIAGRYTPCSRWYEYSRKLLSETLKGRQPSKKCLDAVSKAKKGIPLSAEVRQKISESLIKHIPFYAMSPLGILFNGNCLKEFCKVHDLSFFTISKNMARGIYVIKAGKRKGWVFSSYEIIDGLSIQQQEINNSIKNYRSSIFSKNGLHGKLIKV